MNIIRIAFVWTTYDIKDSLIFNLIKKISKKRIVIVPPYQADLIIYGAYNWIEKQYHLLRFLKRKFRFIKIENFIDKYQMKLINRNSFSRNYKPVTFFYNQEYLSPKYIKADFVSSPHLGITDDNHLNFSQLTEQLDWSSEGIIRSPSENAKRLGKYINISDLLIPQGDVFLKKKKQIFIITSHLNDARSIFYEHFSKNFKIDGFGPAFNKKLYDSQTINQGINYLTKLKIMEDYAFNLCPENNIYPIIPDGRIADAFIGKCLPIGYCNSQTAASLYNPKAFINLNDHFLDNFKTVTENLKDDIFLKSYTQEPLLLKRPTLDKEINFVNKILSCI
jgi:hypothetical protein